MARRKDWRSSADGRRWRGRAGSRARRGGSKVGPCSDTCLSLDPKLTLSLAPPVGEYGAESFGWVAIGALFDAEDKILTFLDEEGKSEGEDEW